MIYFWYKRGYNWLITGIAWDISVAWVLAWWEAPAASCFVHTQFIRGYDMISWFTVYPLRILEEDEFQ